MQEWQYCLSICLELIFSLISQSLDQLESLHVSSEEQVCLQTAGETMADCLLMYAIVINHGTFPLEENACQTEGLTQQLSH